MECRLEVGGRDVNRVEDDRALQPFGDSGAEAGTILGDGALELRIRRVRTIEDRCGREVAGPPPQIVDRKERRTEHEEP